MKNWRTQLIRNRARLDQLRAENADGLKLIPAESLTGILEAVLAEIDHLDNARRSGKMMTRSVMTADLLDLVLRLAACELATQVNDRTEEEIADGV